MKAQEHLNVILFFVVCLFCLLQATFGFTQVVQGSSNNVLVGASRWDAWCAPVDGVEYREQGGPGMAVQRSLSPKKYYFRVPFFGKIISDTLVKIDGYTQDIMDK